MYEKTVNFLNCVELLNWLSSVNLLIIIYSLSNLDLTFYYCQCWISGELLSAPAADTLAILIQK